jgi:nucleotide-binding universal stress UspA family protein
VILLVDKIPFYPIKKILLPTDGSEFSIQAAKYTAKIARKHNSQVTILHVMTVYFPRAPSLRPIKLDDMESVTIEIENEDVIREKAIQIMKKTKKVLIEENVETDADYFLFGDVPELIVKTAKEEKFDLIIMGHKGVTGLAHVLLGGVAERVSRTASCPVLIIRGESM